VAEEYQSTVNNILQKVFKKFTLHGQLSKTFSSFFMLSVVEEGTCIKQTVAAVSG
jgi:hypothetical protein